MSFLRMAAAWERTEVSGTAKLVLLALADSENEISGRCDPPRDELAAKCGVSIKSVGRALAELKAARLVSWVEGHWDKSNAYTFLFAKKSDTKGQNDPKRQGVKGQADPNAMGQSVPDIGSNCPSLKVNMTHEPGLIRENREDHSPVAPSPSNGNGHNQGEGVGPGQSRNGNSNDREPGGDDHSYWPVFDALVEVLRLGRDRDGRKLGGITHNVIDHGWGAAHVNEFTRWWAKFHPGVVPTERDILRDMQHALAGEPPPPLAAEMDTRPIEAIDL